jgi:hypothetical protein
MTRNAHKELLCWVLQIIRKLRQKSRSHLRGKFRWSERSKFGEPLTLSTFGPRHSINQIVISLNSFFWIEVFTFWKEVHLEVQKYFNQSKRSRKSFGFGYLTEETKKWHMEFRGNKTWQNVANFKGFQNLPSGETWRGEIEWMATLWPVIFELSFNKISQTHSIPLTPIVFTWVSISRCYHKISFYHLIESDLISSIISLILIRKDKKIPICQFGCV